MVVGFARRQGHVAPDDFTGAVRSSEAPCLGQRKQRRSGSWERWKSAIHHATAALLNRIETDDVHERVEKAVDFWETVAENMDEWQLVHVGKITAGEVRQDYINSHALVLHAPGRTGQTLLAQTRSALRQTLNPLKKIDWRRSNTSLWEGRAMVGGRVSKAQRPVLLTTNVIKQHLGLDLLPEERRAEDALGTD